MSDREEGEPRPPARLRRVLAAGVGLTLFGLITHGHYAGSGDPVHYMMIAHSLAFDGDLDLADDYADPDNIVTGGKAIAQQHLRPGRGGTLRPVHDVGMPLLWAPFYAAAYTIAEGVTEWLPESLRRRARLSPWIMLRQLLSLSMIVITALLAVVFFDLALRMFGHVAASLAAAWLWALSPPVLTHGYVFFTEVPSALAALLAYRLLLDARAAPWIRAALAGLLSGLLVLLHVRNVGLALGLLGVAFFRLRGARPRLGAFGLAFAIAALARTFVTHHLWGTFVTTPHAAFAPAGGAGATALEMANRGLALLFDQEHGLLLWAPLYLLAPVGFVLVYRRSGRIARELLVLSALYVVPVLLPTLNPHGWRGGWSPAARFLVPITPFLGLPIALVLSEPRLRLLAVPVVAIQVALDGLFWSRPMLTWSEAEGTAPYLPAVGLATLAEWLPSWQRAETTALALSGLTLLVWTVLSVWALKRAR